MDSAVRAQLVPAATDERRRAHPGARALPKGAPAVLAAVPDLPSSPDDFLGRVARVDRGALDLLLPDGPARVPIAAALLAAAAADPSCTPAVGDWVRIAEGRAAEVLPRRTAVVRAAAAGTSHGQVLVANVDLLLVVEPMDPEPDLGRIERLVTLAWESGAAPAVVLTKADLVEVPQHLRSDAAACAPGCPVLAVSSRSGEGLEELRQLVTPGMTVALLGPSGAGKSSLVNALAGEEVMATGEVRADGKGRHTTVHRELLVLPTGVVVIDTPGLRAVGIVSDGAGVDAAFPDVLEAADGCRFRDCEHESEPGCAVREAIEDGRLPQRRLDSWRKLAREAEWMASRHDARLRAERARKWKLIAKSQRSHQPRP